MDPLSIGASVLTVIAAAITTTKMLRETVGRYKGRDKPLGRLQAALDDLINILQSLEEVVDDDNLVLGLLKGPVSRCAQVSREFEEAMKVFHTKSKTGFRDWTKMEFMRGDINEFVDTLADYKSTIMIGLGTVTMKASKTTQKVVGDYNEMVQDTAYNLEIRLQRIDERLTNLATCHPTLVDHSSVDLQDEKAVTIQCLRICVRASHYFQSLQAGQPTLQSQEPQQDTRQLLEQFEAQLWTSKTLSETRDRLVETIGRVQERLEALTVTDNPDREGEKLRLEEELNYSKQCLDVCKEASKQLFNQKKHTMGEVIAEEDSDQIVVTALADLFNAGIVKAKGRSMQMIGSMPVETIQQMSKDRYGSRFRAVDSGVEILSPPPIQMDIEDRGLEEQELYKQKPRRNLETDRPHADFDKAIGEPEHFTERPSIQDPRFREWPRESPSGIGSNFPEFSQVLSRDTGAKTLFSKDSGYSSRVSKAHQPDFDASQEIRDPTKWESESVASVKSLATDNTASSINPTAVGGAAEEFAEMLVKDESICDLIKDGYKYIEKDRFARNLQRVLKNFAINLRKEARKNLEKGAVCLIYNYRAFIIIRIEKYLELPDRQHGNSLHKLQEQEQTQLMLERFLESLPGAGNINAKYQREQNELGSDVDSNLSNDEQPHLPNLKKVKLFLVSSTAYSDFKQELAEFVRPAFSTYDLSSHKSGLVDIDLRSENSAEVVDRDLAIKQGDVRGPASNSKSDVSFAQSGPPSAEEVKVVWNAMLETTQQSEKDRPQSFDIEQHSLTSPELKQGRPEDVLQPRKLRVTASLKCLSLTLRNQWAKWRRKPVAEGRSRVEWTCACGHDLFADFSNQSLDMLHKYAAILKRQPTGNSQNTASRASTNYLACPPTAGLQMNSSSISMQVPQDLNNFPLTSTSQSLSVAANNGHSPSFLELCVNTGPHLKSLAEIDTQNISTDGALFQAIRKQYFSLRGFRSRFWLLKPTAISFVRFSLEKRHRVGILQKPLALPPKSEVDAKNWIYDPCPSEGDPPIAEDLFLHYLQCREGSTSLFWLRRFPQRLEASLLKCDALATFGWGIHIDEGPDFAAIFKANFLVLILSGVAAGLWRFFEHDFQGAFGFACWLVAVLNSLLMAYVFKWKHE